MGGSIRIMQNYGCLVVTIVLLVGPISKSEVIVTLFCLILFSRTNMIINGDTIINCLYCKVDDIESVYTIEAIIASFLQGVYMSTTRDKSDVTLEPYVERERINLKITQVPRDEFFYIHIRVIYSLGVEIPFIVFEFEVFKTINVSPPKYTQTVGPSSGSSKLYVGIWRPRLLQASYSPFMV